jgi:hypothetical protein
MYRKITNDIYPVSEARRRFTAECWRWIYLPILACLGIVIGIAIAIAGSRHGAGIAHWAQLATIFFAGCLMIAGLFVLPFLLGFVGILGKLLDVLPVFTGRMRMNVVLYSYRVQRISRGINSVAGSISGVSSPGRREVDRFWRVPKKRNEGKGGS